MKRLLFLITLFLSVSISQGYSQASSNEEKVIVCNSSTAERYHKYRCHGFNKCTHSSSEIKKSEAVGLGRTPCKICYPNSSSDFDSSSGSSLLKGCPTVQCSGTTQKGLRCKNRTTNCSGRCHYHN